MLDLSYTYRIPRYIRRRLAENIRTHLWRSGLYPHAKKSRESISKLKDAHSGETIYLIGGGPSINQINFDLLQTSTTIACNAFFLKMNELGFLPTYYTVEDPLPAEDNANEINELKVRKLIPIDLRQHITPAANTTYLNFLRSSVFYKSKRFPYFSNDLANCCYWGGTVMYMNLQIAAYLGAKKIVLLGVDMNYSIPDSVKRKGAVLTSTGDDPNHFDPNYFGAGKRWHLPEMERMQRAFDRAHSELAAKNIELINGNLASELKNIPKIAFEDTLPK